MENISKKKDIYYKNLIKKINSDKFNEAIKEIKNGKKESCWAWWAFPTDYSGNELGVPEKQKTKLNENTFITFINELPDKWKEMASAIIDKIKDGKTVKDIFPFVDHNRIKNFIIFFYTNIPRIDDKCKNKSFVYDYINILNKNFETNTLNKKKKIFNDDFDSFRQLVFPLILIGSYKFLTNKKKSKKKKTIKNNKSSINI